MPETVQEIRSCRGLGHRLSTDVGPPRVIMTRGKCKISVNSHTSKKLWDGTKKLRFFPDFYALKRAKGLRESGFRRLPTAPPSGRIL